MVAKDGRLDAEERTAPGRRSGRSRCEGLAARALLLVLLSALPLPAPSGPRIFGPADLRAQVLLTQEEALELAFPEPATVERRSAFLDEDQLTEARRLAGSEVDVDQSVVTYYLATEGGRPVGVAYFDAHRVRTMREVVMIVVSPEAVLERVEILRFGEPPEYMASERWLDQLGGRTLSPGLEVGREIINMTGATLTSGALTRASRRVLAIHEVIDPFGDLSDTGAARPGGRR